MQIRVGHLGVTAGVALLSLCVAAVWAASAVAAIAPTVTRVAPARCAMNAPAAVHPNPWLATRSILAPRGASTIRLCRYSGANSHPALRLTHSVLLRSAGLVRKLVREFDKLPTQGPGAISCPTDDGSEIVAQLAYPSGHRLKISLSLHGCNPVTNGSVTRLAAGVGAPGPFGPPLVAQLSRLTSRP
jgi:hypothetical protein